MRTIERHPSDDTTLTAALAGDEQALGRLLDRHQRVAYATAYRVLRNEADARDAVQEAFLLAIRAIRADRAPPHEHSRFAAWLRRVVTNAALGQLRDRPGAPAVPVAQVAESVPDSHHIEPGRAAERDEACGLILLALLALPRRQHVALFLREYEGRSYAEIADALGVRRSAIGTLLFRAREGFRAAYNSLSEVGALIGCSQLGPLLSGAIQGPPGPEAVVKLHDHVADCPHCGRRLTLRGRRLESGPSPMGEVS